MRNLVCNRIQEQPAHWEIPEVPWHIYNVSQNDPELIRHICENWILPGFTDDLQLENPDLEHYSQSGQSQVVDEILEQKTGGFYIECGAANGEGFSNSLFFEKSRNWTGVLIEANPVNFFRMRMTRRHALMVNACLSPQTTPTVLNFQGNGYIGGLSDFMSDEELDDIKDKKGRKFLEMEVQCFPLASILAAMGVKHVDYFSLDIEGAELDVLKTLPLDDITIDVISVEFRVRAGKEETKKRYQDIVDFLSLYGYEVVDVLGGEDVVLKRSKQ
jgi:FkbM family methyltransferase